MSVGNRLRMRTLVLEDKTESGQSRNGRDPARKESVYCYPMGNIRHPTYLQECRIAVSVRAHVIPVVILVAGVGHGPGRQLALKGFLKKAGELFSHLAKKSIQGAFGWRVLGKPEKTGNR